MYYVDLLPLVLTAMSVQAAAPPALNLVQTIPLPGVHGRFDHFAIDAKGRRLFVAALGNNTLEIIDLANGKLLQSVPGMSKPTGVLFEPQSNRIFVANGNDGTLKIVDGTSFQMTQSLGALDDADNLRYDPKTKLAYLGYGEGALGVIDASAGREIAAIKLSRHPESFQLEKEGNRIFVNVPDFKEVVVIDRARRKVVERWTMAKYQANFPMALDETNHRLFVGCRKPPRLVVLDSVSGKPLADLAISGDTDDLFYDSARKRLYVSCGEGHLDVIDQTGPDTYHLRERIPTRPGARTSFFSPELNQFYLAVPQHGNQPAELRVYQIHP